MKQLDFEKFVANHWNLVHSRRAESGVGGSIFLKTQDIGLASYSNNLSTVIINQSRHIGLHTITYTNKKDTETNPVWQYGNLTLSELYVHNLDAYNNINT